jgi:AraC-like DNA-binding protein
MAEASMWDPGITVLESDDPTTQETPWHRHEEGQVFLIERGLMTTDAGQGRWVMLPGRLGWVPPGVLHMGIGHGPVLAVELLIAPRHCARLPVEPRVYVCSVFLGALFNRIRETVADPDRTGHLLAVLLDELANARPEPLYLPMFQDPRLVRLARALLLDPGKRCDVAAWAAEAGMSRRTLARHVLAETGLTFGQWRNLARLLASLERLGAGESVTTVAFEVGYESVSAFIAGFRGHFGVTPGKYYRG